LRKISVCGVCDVNPANLSEVSDVRGFDDAERMFDQTQPDILIVATPTRSHKSVALGALKRRIHTFVEKPIVTTRAELDELVDTSLKSGVRLMSGHVERYNPVSIKIRALLQNVQSSVESYAFARIQRHSDRIPDDIIVDKVIHDLDLARYFFGKISDIEIQSTKRVNGKICEAMLSLRHTTGAAGTLFVSWLTDADTKKRQVEIRQGGHIWKGDFVAKRLWVDEMEIVCQVEGMIAPSNNQVKDELVDFIAYASELSLTEPVVPLLMLDEIAESIQWLESIVKTVAKN
jgi:predicted dehydrogenase